MRNVINYTPIGVINTPFKTIENCPIQPTASKGTKGTITIFEEFEDGLKDIEGFSHLVLIYHLHLVTGYSLEVIPFLDTVSHGIFAVRSPIRPNPIGFSIVRFIEKTNNQLTIQDIDIIDGTPLLDIKPYISDFDERTDTKKGWVKHKKIKNTVSDNRFKNKYL